MKKISIQRLITLSAFCVLLASCKKDDPPQPPAETTVSLLQNKNWKMTAFTFNPAYYGMTDFYQAMEACAKDNFYRFNATKEFVIDEGLGKCDPADPQTTSGTWSYNESTKILHTDINQAGDDISIVQIDANSFTGKETITDGGVTYVATIAFVKQ